MTCQELTTFINKVFDSRNLIDNPGDDFESARNLVDNIETVTREIQPHNLALRLEISQKLDLEYVGDFYDGWAVVKKNGKEGFVNEKGEFLHNEKGEILWFTQVDRFSEEVAIVYAEEDRSILFLSNKGTILATFDSQHIPDDDLSQYRFSHGFSVLRTGQTGRKYVDKKGNTTFKLNENIAVANKFSDSGLAKVMLEGTSGFQFINSEGNILITEDGLNSFHSATDFSEGLAWILIELSNDKKVWRIINANGEYSRSNEGRIISYRGSEYSPSEFCNGLSSIRRVHPVYGTIHNFYINSKDYSITPEDHTWFDGQAADFSEDFAIIMRNNVKRFMNKRGRFLRQPNGQIIEMTMSSNKFEDGLAKVQFIGSSEDVYINRYGRIVEFGTIQPKTDSELS